MFQQIIDRRQAGKNKSIGNRERFLRRHQEHIREAVRRAVQRRGIRDIEQGEDITIPRKDLSEPVFQHSTQGGVRDTVYTGNTEHVTGDRLTRPKGGQGAGQGSQASNSGEGEDDFVFSLSKEEFMEIFFEDLALPNMMRTQLTETPEYKTHRAGLSNEGTPNNLHIVRSLRGAHGRRLTLGASARQAFEQALERLTQLRQMPQDDPIVQREITELCLRIDELERKIARIPFLDPLDLRFRNRVRTPVPTAKAVMFCVMDVSGSMDEERKDLSKRFFILLYLFLTRHYEHIDLVFIRHHTQAQEVSEQDFFQARETGGTVVSSALVLMAKIIRERYSPSDWNIYGAQASDGDNWDDDDAECQKLLGQDILPMCRYFAYVQVVDAIKTLWTAYEALQPTHPNFAMRKFDRIDNIYPVFRDLFKKEAVTP